jgi:hypothetical protein
VAAPVGSNFLRLETDRAVYAIGSGEYVFQAQF